MSSNYVAIWKQKFENTLKDNSEEFFKQWFSEELSNEYLISEKEYLLAVKNYKTNHNSFGFNMLKFFGLPLSLLCLGIPFFPAWKKYKQLRANKQQLEQVISDEKSEKLAVHSKFLTKIDLLKWLCAQYKILGYTHVGAIDQNLIDELQQLSLFDLNDSANSNSYNSSWGIVNNKIIINLSNHTHKMIDKTYTNTITVTSNDKTYTYVASYTHPVPVFKLTTKSFTFMESCSNLTFNYEKEYFGNLFKKSSRKSRGQSALENPEFEKNIHWIRNDEVQFRMIFTPLAQENYINEVYAQSKEHVLEQFKFSKVSSFFTNQHFRSSILFNNDATISKWINQFLTGADYNLDKFKNDLSTSLLDHIHDFYLSINYLWMIPIFESENHSAIINHVLKSKFQRPCTATFHYLLNEILQHKILVKDTDTFHQVQYISNFNNNENMFIGQISGLSYESVPKTTYVSVWTVNGVRSVPVRYIDYIPYQKEGFIFYTYIETDLHYLPQLGSNNINDVNILEKIASLTSSSIIVCLAENYLVFYAQDEATIYQVCDLINEMITLLKSSSSNK